MQAVYDTFEELLHFLTVYNIVSSVATIIISLTTSSEMTCLSQITIEHKITSVYGILYIRCLQINSVSHPPLRHICMWEGGLLFYYKVGTFSSHYLPGTHIEGCIEVCMN